MLMHIAIWFLIVRLSIAQLNGEFWWLNDRLAGYQQVQPPPPKFEDLSEFDNDESVKIVFKDDKITGSVATTIASNMTGRDKVKHNAENVSTDRNEHLKGQPNQPESNDRFVFKFPEEENVLWKGNSNTIEVAKLPFDENAIEGSSVIHDDKVSWDTNKQEKTSKNVCNFMKKSGCYRNNGIVQQVKYAKKIYINQQLICCVLPQQSKHEYVSSQIYFPDDPRETMKLRKRSTDELKNLKLRSILLQRRRNYSSRQGTTQRIATPDYEDDDPYWNIKTLKSSNKKQQFIKEHEYEYDTDDYEEDYASEIPKPGLTGLYSDNLKPSSWPPQNEEKYGEYSDEFDYGDTGTFGYSTVDPRRVTDSTKRKPLRLTTASEKNSHDAESQTITYQSKPNFNVFQDFKLLLTNKGRPKVQKMTTTADSIVYDRESLGNTEDENSDYTYKNREVYHGCGKTVFFSQLKKLDKQVGETVNGSHPWLALVVLTRKRDSILCYATLIHPRAAITVAHCVYRKSPVEITLLSGMRVLNEIPHTASRVASIRVHSEYRHGELAHNLAMLHWLRPLEMSVNVQPACLADPHFGYECMFFGWGGFDQAMKRRPRWQRASILSCNGSLSLVNGESLPNDAFCATVVSRSTVTGMGGSLMCSAEGRLSAVGVAITRDSTLAMLPIRQWALAAMSALN